MSFISGLGRPEYSIPTPIQKSANSAEDFLSLTDSTVPTSSTAMQSVASNQSSATSQQSEQDREEAFAKMMVQLQNPTVAQNGATTSSDDSSDSLAAIAGTSGTGAASGTDSSSSAIDDFQNYMKMSPGEKMRYAAMSSLGVSPEAYAAMSPADKAKVDTKIADIMKKQQEMLANGSGATAPAAATASTADSSGSGSSTDSQQPSFLNKALAALTQSATDAASSLALG